MNSVSVVVAARSVLGIGRQWSSPIQLIDEINKGFPVIALDRLCKVVAPDDAGFKYRFASKSSLQRLISNKRRHALLSRQQSEQIMRVACVWIRAVEVWGDERAARRFLGEPHSLLDGRTPIEIALSADIGLAMIEDILGRLQYGIAV